MGISPRSRWSNRDDSSFRDNPEQENWSPSIHKWRSVKAGSGAPMLLIGQAIGIASLAMLHSGVKSAQDLGVSEGFNWGSGSPAFLIMALFSTISAFILFRVSRSRRATRGRKRMAKLSLLTMIILFVKIIYF
ncbi:MAG: hypothetical protein VYD27_04760 [Candidatus Thermoplasmatota archaeon]|nr:hypothetical protein [Candidatus Thermoplasmatota archaeon]